MIIMVSSIGDMWLDEAIANPLAKAIKGNTKFVTLNGNFIAVSSIRALLTPEAYKLMVTTRKFNWVCKYGAGHTYTDNCQCKPAVQMSNAAQLEQANPLTPEQQAEKDRRASASLAWLNKYKHNFKSDEFKDRKKRQAFIDNFKVERSK